MAERKGVITLLGKPLTLQGRHLNIGDKAPDAMIVDNDMAEVKLSSFRGKVQLISSVPSLDTPVCDVETRKFNEKLASLSSNVSLLTISMDLPFAQKRWCGAAGVKNVKTFSDYRSASFGENYGVLIKELRLLARAVFVVDASEIIRYIQIVPEISSEPDYEKAIQETRKLI